MQRSTFAGHCETRLLLRPPIPLCFLPHEQWHLASEEILFSNGPRCQSMMFVASGEVAYRKLPPEFATSPLSARNELSFVLPTAASVTIVEEKLGFGDWMCEQCCLPPLISSPDRGFGASVCNWPTQVCGRSGIFSAGPCRHRERRVLQGVPIFQCLLWSSCLLTRFNVEYIYIHTHTHRHYHKYIIYICKIRGQRWEGAVYRTRAPAFSSVTGRFFLRTER